MRASAGSPPDETTQVVLIIADGARFDTLATAMDDGRLSALSALRREGGLYGISSTFPSVTGPAYAPFLMGRYPGDVGLPGLRWFDRSRTAPGLVGHSRSYVGMQMRFIDRDVDAGSPTIFELVQPCLGALNVINRGLPERNRIGAGLYFNTRAALTHFRGDVRGWLRIDAGISREVVRRIREERPRFTFAAFTGIDKTSHAEGQDSGIARDALKLVDSAVAGIRADAERDGRWERMYLWVCSDHGHTAIHSHEDLARLVATAGYSVTAHPWAFNSRADVAVMVSGNAMAHIYVELERRERPGWNAIRTKWHDLLLQLEARDSVDVVLLPKDPGKGECEVRARDRGSALVRWSGGRYGYSHGTGNPLGIPECAGVSSDDAHALTFDSDYPDSIVQIAHLCASPRAGDIILSAARDWDFRARHEPIPHISSHGSLLRDHMLVPLLTNRPAVHAPRRTVDVMPSALRALGITVPQNVEGRSFL